MTTIISREYYEKVIQADIKWLRTMSNTLERHHIIRVLKSAVEYEYDFIKPLRPNEE